MNNGLGGRLWMWMINSRMCRSLGERGDGLDWSRSNVVDRSYKFEIYFGINFIFFKGIRGNYFGLRNLVNDEVVY